MISPIDRQAIAFRNEHYEISRELEEQRQLALERYQNPSRLRILAAHVTVRIAPPDVALGAAMAVLAGPKITHEIGDLQAYYGQNILAASAHVAENLDSYIAAAQETEHEQ